MDELRGAHTPLPELPNATQVVDRLDKQWADDDEAIAKLAAYFNVPAALENGSSSHIELERHWKLNEYTHDAVHWRERAWFYRSVLVALGRQRIKGFQYRPTRNDKYRRWTSSSLHVLRHAVEEVIATRQCSELDAVRFLLTDSLRNPSTPFFRSDMTFDNARKLLHKAKKLPVWK
ncbi:MAG: hypothetical protein ABUL58_00190 [Steroidobacter sp.]